VFKKKSLIFRHGFEGCMNFCKTKLAKIHIFIMLSNEKHIFLKNSKK